MRRYGSAFEIVSQEYTIKDLVVDEEYGTVLAAICFIDYILPEARET
jgi:hypothetical protein